MEGLFIHDAALSGRDVKREDLDFLKKSRCTIQQKYIIFLVIDNSENYTRKVV
jgi:hypothetical protein